VYLGTGNADVLLAQNIVARNRAITGGGGIVGWAEGAPLINNTIVENDAPLGSGLTLIELLGNTLMANNIVFTRNNQAAVYCASPMNPGTFRFNNVFSAQTSAYGGFCGNQTNSNGNISADPKFVDERAANYRLRLTSPSIDAGSNSEPGVPPTDFDGNPRIIEGDGNGLAVIDMGAYEFNTNPVANAGPDQTVTCDASCLAAVLLDGRASSDPNGDQLTFTWTGPFGTASGPTPSVSLPKGQNEITLTVSDPAGHTSSDSVVITVIDLTPPAITAATASPAVLIQANHQMVPVTVAVSATDNCDRSVTCRIVSVTSNEPVEGLGDGDTAPDWEITGTLTLNLRAERSGKGTGRVYTIAVECTDSSNNKSTSTVAVNVPRNN
jgi:hypothetical protein